jgi:hypothetical protein
MVTDVYLVGAPILLSWIHTWFMHFLCTQLGTLFDWGRTEGTWAPFYRCIRARLQFERCEFEWLLQVVSTIGRTFFLTE